ncbi:hypothetical protein D5H75_28530 [Bailinhaonella thermotolerans]|uniref:Uncharacterized protein n=1 Tax=Bailinhaonella thermotolerans TaxID=1070861 RepID=A0A3A4ATJ9_9ACTN|nr:hypothetical protein D5H75_28530 [Bailinhaonella thermotolerans]
MWLTTLRRVIRTVMTAERFPLTQIVRLLLERQALFLGTPSMWVTGVLIRPRPRSFRLVHGESRRGSAQAAGAPASARTVPPARTAPTKVDVLGTFPHFAMLLVTASATR